MNKGTFTVSTTRRMEFVDITTQLEKAIAGRSGDSTLCCVYNPHTTAGLTINEGADPAVQEDIISVLNTIVPHKHPYRHMEGNSPAHVKATLVGPSEMIAVENGKLVLGTWQGIFFCEFDGPRSRRLHVHLFKSLA